jgi:mono/diheme cytochrome c family protein
MTFRLLLLLLASSAVAAPVSFQREVAPLLQRRCAACHGTEQAKGGYRLDSFARLTQPGESGLPALVPGRPAESELTRLLREPSAEDRMPQKADALPEAEITLLERWVAEGAGYDGGAATRPLAELVRATMLRAAPKHYPRPLPITALAFSPEGTHVATAGYHEVLIWKVIDGTLTTRIDGLPERITALAWHPHLPLLAVAGGTPQQWGTVALADPANLAPVRFLGDQPDTMLCLAFSPDGGQLAAGGADRTVRLYDGATGTERRALRLHADWVQTVAFSADGRRLLTASRDRTARVVDPDRGEVLASYTGHTTPLVSAAFAGDGRVAWTAARGGTLHRWEPASAAKKGDAAGAEYLGLLGLRDGVLAWAADRQLRRFTGSGAPAVWPGPDAFPQCAALSPDGTTLALGTADGHVTLLALADGRILRAFAAWPR